MLFGNSRNTLKPLCFPNCSDILRLWDGGTRMALLNPMPGVYNFGHLDSHLDAANGIDSIYVFGSTPAWAAIPTTGTPGAYDATSNRPMDLGALGDFVDALMTHVGTRIKYFETWNEWNANGFFCGTLDQLVQQQWVIYSGIKRHNPLALVTTPTPCWNPTSAYPTVDVAMDAFLSRQAPFDLVSFHGYLPNGADAMDIIPTLWNLRAVLDKYGVTSPVWDTEYGPNAPANIAPDQQRLWMLNSLIAREMNSISLACFYQWDNQTHGTCTDLLGNLTVYGKAWNDFYYATKIGMS